jgi:Photosynthetic reaction centre cytochrome C subunit
MPLAKSRLQQNFNLGSVPLPPAEKSKSFQENCGLKKSSLSLPAAATVLLAAAVFAVTTVAQAPQADSAQPGSAGGPPPPRDWPAPTNLQVLPKNLTGQQVRDIMEKWEGSLGTHCSTCHAADPKNIGPNGRPRINFADDSKEEKLTARLMYKMTEDINVNYVSKVPNSDMPVACGTCHRGHLDPEPFVIPEEDHNGPRRPEGTPPAGAVAPQPH